MIATDRLDYALPPELVAQKPSQQRDGSRLLVVDRYSHTTEHRHFSDLPDYIRRGDTLLRNNASVLPARLLGRRPTGGKIECFLLRKAAEAPQGGEDWQCLVRPGRRLPAGSRFEAAASLQGTVVSVSPDGTVLVRFVSCDGASVAEAANKAGEVPLPPYIVRDDSSRREEDRDRYQTVYADPARQVAVAAPTAGLHFTPAVLGRIEAKGAATADLTLHVGLGTFRPIATEFIEAHPIHSEIYEIPAATQKRLFKKEGGRRFAVGTTTVRTVEDFLSRHDAPTGGNHVSEASIYIHPPFSFRGVDAMITNFHQPRSTLLCLVAAFLDPGGTAGIDWLMQIYAEAVSRRYRFFSYGDSMLIL
ncbi:MAG TPA: tRNA preQ1(34) S-adenosylmethionine ribosyltransferase-isomerase QueA [Opitutaceae bacterium]